MAIPLVAPYPMPTDEQLPGNRVNWRPDPRRAALLVHDMQRYFLRAYRQDEAPLTDLLANAADLIAACRDAGAPVIHTAQPGAQAPEDRGLLTDFWGKGMQDVAEDTAIVGEVAPDVSGAVLCKWRYSAFFRSDLERRLRAARRDQLIICGVYAHIGCATTAVEAFSRGFEVFLAADAVADFSARRHLAALSWAAGCCAVVSTTRHLTSCLRR
ncbi:isochorismatase family protein [Sphaerisporangium dianthi]|uniref:Isochorismatase family protein n=1 Tax=Sphaerisporangium dianthi TaxID=1436120 RepID=A0ABV9CU15_9ACTN